MEAPVHRFSAVSRQKAGRHVKERLYEKHCETAVDISGGLAGAGVLPVRVFSPRRLRLRRGKQRAFLREMVFSNSPRLSCHLPVDTKALKTP